MYKQEVQPIQVIRNLKAQGKAEEAQEFAKIVSGQPLKFFCPNLVQEKIINGMVLAHKEANNAGKSLSTALYTCGNGVGKTLVTIHIIANLVYGPQNGWFDHELFHHWPFPKHITLITTPGNLNKNYFATSSGAASFRNVLWDKWDSIDVSKGGKGHVSHVDFNHNGWQMDVVTYNQDATEVESFTTGFVDLDEPAPLPIWRALPSRMRKGAITLAPMTPLECEPYVLDEIIKKADEGVPGYVHITASVRDVLETKERGHYSLKAFSGQVEKYTEEEKAARIDGMVMFFKERIIDNYDPDVHFVNPADYPLKPNYLYYHITDPGDGKPNAEIWGAVTPEGRHIIFFEAPLDKSMDFWDFRGGMTVQDHVQQFLYIENKLSHENHIYLNPTRIIDYHFANQTRGGRKTTLWDDYEEVSRKLGISLSMEPSYTVQGGNRYELSFGHKKMRQLLQCLPDGKPGLVIWNTCHHANNGMLHYVRKRPRTEAAMLKHPDSWPIVEKYKDFPDVIRYFCCADVQNSIQQEDDYDDYGSIITDAADAF